MSVWPYFFDGSPHVEIHPLEMDGPTFVSNGSDWRWKGVSAFRLCRRFADGENIEPFLRAFAGFNTLRVWDYVTWPETGWESCDAVEWSQFLRYVAELGWYVELTLLTDDDSNRISPAKSLVYSLSAENHPNLVLEIGNEPNIHKNIDVDALRQACESSRFPFASGLNEVPADQWFGSYLTAHTPRDGEWPRKCHNLLEYYHGGGPGAPTDPPHHVPCIADEPIRPDQAGFIGTDFRAYFGGCALLGGGGTFHFENGKYALLPTPQEANCASEALRGLNAFPNSAPRGNYRRIDEQGKTSRTYVVDDCMVRIRPTTPMAPEPGWTALDHEGILWRRTQSVGFDLSGFNGGSIYDY